MAYKTNDDLPDGVKSALPAEAQNLWREVFNKTAADRPDDEEAVRKIAWGAVKNAGWEKGDGGAWTKKTEHADTHSFEAEVFSAGTHKGDPYTEADLDDMVRNFAGLSGVIKPPVKAGHGSRLHVDDGQPALGWVTELKRAGRKLIESSAALSGSSTPRISAHVAARSLRQTVASQVCPGFTRAGQRTMNGSRWPPS